MKSEYELTEYGKALEVVAGFQSFIGEHEGSIVGHSLGASLASFASMASGIKATVFNPAAIHDNTLTTFGIDTSNHQSLINTYVIDGEIVNKINQITPNAEVYGAIHLITNVSGGSLEKHKMGIVNKTLSR